MICCSSSQSSVRVSTVLEEGQIEHVPVVAPSRKVASISRHHSFPGKCKMKVARSLVKLPHQFEC